MNKFSFILLTYFVLHNCIISKAQFSQDQQAQIDSLTLIIQKNEHDTSVANAYVKLSEILYVSNLDTMIVICETAKSISQQNLAKSSLNMQEKRAFQGVLAIAVNNIGFVHNVHGDFAIALEHFLEALEIYEDIEDRVGLTHSYNNIGAMYNSLGDVDKALQYYQKSFEMGQELGDSHSMAYSLNNIGYLYKTQGNLREALKYYEESLKAGLEVGNKSNIANTYNNIGVLHRDLGDYEMAMEYYNKALKIQEEIQHQKGMASSFGNIGHIYNLLGDIPLSLEYYHKSLKIREEIGEKNGIALSLANIGSIYKDQGDIDLALEYYQKALKIHEETGEQKGIAHTYNKIGLIFSDEGDFSIALEYQKNALKIHEELKSKQGIGITLNYLGIICNELGDLSMAMDYFQKSLKIHEEIGEKIGIAKSTINIGSLYEVEGEYINAIKHGKKALEIAREIAAVKEIEIASKLLYKAYKNTGQDNNALQMHELFIDMRDSLLNEENTRAVIIQEMNYKHEKELQSERLALAEQKHKDKLRQQKKNQFTYASFGLITFIGLLGYLVMRNRQRKKELLRQQRHNEKLKNLDKLKDQFLANTSHELRTPLQGIIGLSESLHEKEANQKKKQELGMITSSGKRLASLVNSILDFSKLKTHELKLSLRAIDLRTITDTVLQICTPLIKGKSIALVNEIATSIPLVEADEDRVYQILHNLIGNAIKFTSDGEITISAVENQDMVQVCIKDTGIGIPEDKIDDIFKSFEQVDASITREHGGTGLGLTITKQLIELHHGTIWIESNIDQGTQVYFTLPKSSEKLVSHGEQEKISRVIMGEEDEQEIVLSSEPTTQSIKSKFNILIVDDEPINQQVMSNHLGVDNFRIQQALNGMEALVKLENEKPDLILLDIMMPKMSGYEVCKEIRKKYLPSELPIIMITAKDQITDLVEGLGSGANDYLAKPFSKNELLARLKTHLNLYHINSAYLRFVPKEFLNALGHESIIDVALGDQVQGDMTILFSDIRSFTSITEKMSARESFEFLNEFLESITPAITTNGGFIDKYIGDAIMALFPSNPEDAIISAIQVQDQLSEYNKTRESNGKEKIKIGIGIHTGPLMLGTIGVKDRMDGTVISDAVNLASRLEELNKLYGTSMIVSDSTLQQLDHTEKYNYRFLSFARVKGKENAIKVYEFFDGDESSEKAMKLATLATFKEGIKEYYNQKFTRASVKFQDVIDSYPEDHTARLFLEKSAQYMVQGVPEHWDGVDIVEKVL